MIRKLKVLKDLQLAHSVGGDKIVRSVATNDGSTLNMDPMFNIVRSVATNDGSLLNMNVFQFTEIQIL